MICACQFDDSQTQNWQVNRPSWWAVWDSFVVLFVGFFLEHAARWHSLLASSSQCGIRWSCCSLDWESCADQFWELNSGWTQWRGFTLFYEWEKWHSWYYQIGAVSWFMCVRRCVGRSFIPSAVSCRMGMRCLVGQMTNDVSHVLFLWHIFPFLNPLHWERFCRAE